MSVPATITALGVRCVCIRNVREHEWLFCTDELEVEVTHLEDATWRVVQTVGMEGGPYVGIFEGTGLTLEAAEVDLIAHRLELVRRLTGGAQ